MRTYYRGPEVVVTSTVFTHESVTYAIRDLHDVCIHHLTTGVVLWRLRPRTFVLHATYRGIGVALYTSTDERVFNQVSRALRRAIEESRMLSFQSPPAAA